MERGLINEGKFREKDKEDENTELHEGVRQITYEYKTENIEVVLANGVNFSFHAKVKLHLAEYPKKNVKANTSPLSPN